MFHSSVVVDVSLSPVSISSAAVPYCVHNAMPTITSVHVLVNPLTCIFIIPLNACTENANARKLAFICMPLYKQP